MLQKDSFSRKSQKCLKIISLILVVTFSCQSCIAANPEIVSNTSEIPSNTKIQIRSIFSDPKFQERADASFLPRMVEKGLSDEGPWLEKIAENLRNCDHWKEGFGRPYEWEETREWLGLWRGRN